jgi:hypothetical protein
MLVYQILSNGYLGEVLEFSDGEGIPLGYTRTPPPPAMPGHYVKWGPFKWEVTLTPPPPEPEPERIISKLAFMNRLTDDEYIEMLRASKTDIAIEAWFHKFNLMSNIILNNLKLNIFVENNILSQQRVEEILKSPVRDNERPN